MNPYFFANRRGIPVIKTTAVTVGADAVTLTFPPHSFANTGYRGLVLVELAQSIPTGTTATLPINLSTNGVPVALSITGGATATVADFPGPGIYQLYYDKFSNLLQLMTGTPRAAEGATTATETAA